MSKQPPDGRDRLTELLADRALFGLTAEEDRELNELLAVNPAADVDELARLAAVLDTTACVPDLPPLPPEVVARVRAQAPHPVPAGPQAVPRPRLRTREVLAWLTAAGCLLVAVYAWTTRNPDAPNPPPTGAQSPLPPRDTEAVPPTAPVAPTLAQQREELLAAREGVLHIRLSESVDTSDPTVSGDVVWSPSQQRGFLRLQGLPPNDPTKSQYQLWMVEAMPARHEAVNGGVFDVTPQARELIVPIRADHFVRRPNMFVISIEPPGGSPDLTAGGYPLVARLGDTP
jgi:hypothetical protein